MNTPGEMTRALVLLGALAALACSCKGRSGSEPLGGDGATTAPALWEPIDKNFTACEGG